MAGEFEVVFKALAFAAHAHREQRRKGTGEPYVNHLIDVAELLAAVAGVNDPEILAAAVLHDVIEDTATTPRDIERVFGARICALVQALTDDKSLPKEERKRLQIEHMRDASPDVRLIKLADHSSNIAALPDVWPLERRAAYLDWSEQVVAGCIGVSPELEAEYAARFARARKALSAG